MKYNLFGVINHHGVRSNFGHYTAFAKNPESKKWYKFDDSTVTEENENAICTNEAYVLLYTRN